VVDPEKREEEARRDLREGKLDRALESARQAVAQKGASAAAHALLAQVHLARGDRERAFDEAAQAVTLDRKLAAAWAVEAAAFAARRDWRSALSDAKRALELDAKTVLAVVVEGEASFFLEAQPDPGKAIAAALEAARRARLLDPGLGSVWRLEALASLAQGPAGAQSAAAAARKAIERDPSSPWGYYVSGACRADSGRDLDLAEADFARALELDPENGYVLARRALLRWRRHDLGSARTDAEAAVLRAPDDPAAWVARAFVRRDAGDLPGAVADADAALALTPRCVPAWLAKADAERRSGDLDAADRDVREGLFRDDRNLGLHLCRGRIYVARRDPVIALFHFDRYFDVAPQDDPDYKSALDDASKMRMLGGGQ
jgi:tetratricopeptide (TPR) repeat protein